MEPAGDNGDSMIDMDISTTVSFANTTTRAFKEAAEAAEQYSDEGSFASDSSIPCAPTSTNQYISPSTPHRNDFGTAADSPDKTRRPSVGSYGGSANAGGCYEMTPVARNTCSAGQFGSVRNSTPAAKTLLPIVISPEEDHHNNNNNNNNNNGPPREIGYFIDQAEVSVGGVLSGQQSYFNNDSINTNNNIMHHHLNLPDKDYVADRTSATQKFMSPRPTATSSARHHQSYHNNSFTFVGSDQRDNDSFMYLHEDDCDTLDEDNNYYQEDDGEEEGQDHIGKILFPVRTKMSQNLSFHSLDEGGFRRAIQQGHHTSSNPPLVIGRSPPNLSQTYQPVRNDSLTDFGFRESAIEAGAIFKDDDEASLYRPIPLRKGNSTGTHYSIPSIRLGVAVFGDDNSSIRSTTDFGSESGSAWWNDDNMSDVGSLRGSFDEVDGFTARVESAASRAGRKQQVFNWLEDVRNQDSGVQEAASSKFLREPLAMAASSLPHRKASTRFTPVAVGNPQRKASTALAPSSVIRGMSISSAIERTLAYQENENLRCTL